MKLKRVEKKLALAPEEIQKARKSSTDNTLPEDGYKPIFPPIRIKVREYPNAKATFLNKDYLEFKVMHLDDDEAPTCVFVSLFKESEKYTGYTKKNIHFPISAINDVIETIEELGDKCDEAGIEF